MKKIIMIFGTRPEAIKMCPVFKALKKRKNFEVIICLSGQHKEMLNQVMKEFGVEYKYNINVMTNNQTLSDITSQIIVRLDEILKEEKPDIVIVHGDTTTSFAAALVSFYNNIKVAHVEAGLRTYDMKLPFPEEFNRQAVDLVSDFYFAPTELSRQNLIKEGKEKKKIYVTGNTGIDALKLTICDNYTNELLDWAEGSRLILFTAHRRESIGEPMEEMFKAIKRIVNDFSDVKIIFPVHKNPKVREIVNKILDNNDAIKLVEPLDIKDFHNIMRKCYLVVTDSGGIQEEAPALGKPVVVMRNETERVEAVESGTVVLAGTQEDKIYNIISELLTNREMYNGMSSALNPYGDGYASERIADILEKELLDHDEN